MEKVSVKDVPVIPRVSAVPAPATVIQCFLFM